MQLSTLLDTLSALVEEYLVKIFDIDFFNKYFQKRELSFQASFDTTTKIAREFIKAIREDGIPIDISNLLSFISWLDKEYHSDLINSPEKNGQIARDNLEPLINKYKKFAEISFS
jgi:hypothetical protein